jgi:hypothetical protein
MSVRAKMVHGSLRFGADQFREISEESGAI